MIENEDRIIQEEKIQEKIDEDGNKWRKVYFGYRVHFQNSLKECQELAKEMGTEIKVEEIDPAGFPCFNGKGEKMYRIWIKEKKK